MFNTVAVGRQLARRALVWQTGAIAVTALAFLPKGAAWAISAALGGAAVAIGGALSGAVALGGGVAPSTGALMRVLLGTLVKWMVVIGVLALVIGKGLPPVAALAGVIAAVVAQMLAMVSANRRG